MHYTPAEPVDTSAASASPALSDPATVISNLRYNTNSRGNKHFYLPLARECTRILGALVTRWKSSHASGDAISVEVCWAEFLSALEGAATNSIGVKRDRGGRPGVPRRTHEPGDPIGARLKRIRKALLQSKSATSPHGPTRERWLRFEAELKQLNQRIHSHTRKLVRRAEEQELAKVQALQAHQKREHWAALKAVGGIVPSKSSVPAVATDSAGEEHKTAEGVRCVWRETWAKLAEHRLDDPRYNAELAAEIEQSVREQECI
jgi:hypothetical protein